MIYFGWVNRGLGSLKVFCSLLLWDAVGVVWRKTARGSYQLLLACVLYCCLSSEPPRKLGHDVTKQRNDDVSGSGPETDHILI